MPDPAVILIPIEALPGALYVSWVQLIEGLRVTGPPLERHQLSGQLAKQAILFVEVHPDDVPALVARTNLPLARFRIYDQDDYMPAMCGD